VVRGRGSAQALESIKLSSQLVQLALVELDFGLKLINLALRPSRDADREPRQNQPVHKRSDAEQSEQCFHEWGGVYHAAVEAPALLRDPLGQRGWM
jgi:hypothetical protein